MTSEKKKFDETDRNKMISEIEEFLHIKLTKFCGKQKLLREEYGDLYILFGGKDIWSTIDFDTLDIVEREVSKTGKKAFMAFGDLLNTKMVIYLGPLEIENLDKRELTHKHLKIEHDSVTFRGFSGFRMKRIRECIWNEQERESRRKFEKFMSEIKTMSEEERKALLKGISEDENAAA